MIIEAMVIRDFGPYFGEQRVELGAGKEPLTLVHGENMRGKTSLLNAIRWCLYGEVPTRTGGKFDLARLHNTDARDAGSTSMAVDLRIQEGPNVIELARQADFKSKPPSVTTHVRRNGDFLDQAAGQVEVQRLLPRDISQFFLFDGEMLEEFEDLVSDSSSQAQVIKESIEQILGVPALENAINDVSQIMKDAQRRRDHAARSVAAAQKDAQRAEEIETQIELVLQSLNQIDSQLNETQGEIGNIDDQLRGLQGVAADAQRVADLRIDRTSNEATVRDLQQRRRELLVDAWQDVIAIAVEPRVQALEEERDRIMFLVAEQSRHSAVRELLEDGLHGEWCPTCGNQIGGPQVAFMQQRLSGLPSDEGAPEADLESIASSLSRLRSRRPPNVGPSVEAVENELRGARIRGTELASKITEIEKRLANHDVAAVAHLQRERDRLVAKRGALDKEGDGLRDQIALLKSEAAQARARIAGVSDPQINRLNREVEAYGALVEIYEQSLTALRDELRNTIEEDASEIFRQLTTDKSYRRLRINEYYGLFIVDSNERDVLVRSAGAEQVVALALIGALNRNAVRRGPVIMDTPLGRLDVKHRENILKFLATMAQQVVLLVHSGEFDKDRDFPTVAPYVQRQLELRYVSSARTEIDAL
jgi:DNA sulfur modification protein DndD